MLILLPLCASRHKHTRSSLWVTERGRVIVPCKDWPSAPACGGCGLDKGLSPGPRLPPRDRRRSPVADERRGHSNERAGQTVIAISNRWFSRNFSLSLTAERKAMIDRAAELPPQGPKYRDAPLKIVGEHDEGTVAQMLNCMAVGNVLAGVICADGHLGYAQPVGGVIAYEKQISISGVGFDIGCGNMAVRLDTSFF